MFTPTRSMEELARRARQGDIEATRHLRRQMEEGLPPMVRRTMRTRIATTPVAQRILAEADLLAADGGDDLEEREWVIEEVTRRVCDEMMKELQPRSACPWAGRETVLA